MSTLEQLRNQLGQAWGSLAEGWRQIRQRAANALTYFAPSRKAGEVETAEQQYEQRAPRWGLLSADMWSDDRNVVVSLEAPGMDRDDFDITVVDHYLVVRGEKRMRRERTAGHVHSIECAYGRFERALALPAEVDSGAARASYRNGVLRIELPLRHRAQGRRISVQTD